MSYYNGNPAGNPNANHNNPNVTQNPTVISVNTKAPYYSHESLYGAATTSDKIATTRGQLVYRLAIKDDVSDNVSGRQISRGQGDNIAARVTMRGAKGTTGSSNPLLAAIELEKLFVPLGFLNQGKYDIVAEGLFQVVVAGLITITNNSPYPIAAKDNLYWSLPRDLVDAMKRQPTHGNTNSLIPIVGPKQVVSDKMLSELIRTTELSPDADTITAMLDPSNSTTPSAGGFGTQENMMSQVNAMSQYRESKDVVDLFIIVAGLYSGKPAEEIVQELHSQRKRMATLLVDKFQVTNVLRELGNADPKLKMGRTLDMTNEMVAHGIAEVLQRRVAVIEKNLERHRVGVAQKPAQPGGDVQASVHLPS